MNRTANLFIAGCFILIASLHFFLYARGDGPFFQLLLGIGFTWAAAAIIHHQGQKL